ncbi:MAG: hypothetical protein HC771_13105 [Synechococcales cyanobacterium CRU_2_2]|nr:hypothetical protein [Synechococcales cyanobacterium CRU_2_2]
MNMQSELARYRFIRSRSPQPSAKIYSGTVVSYSEVGTIITDEFGNTRAASPTQSTSPASVGRVVTGVGKSYDWR